MLQKIGKKFLHLKKMELLHLSYFFFVLLTLTFAMIALVRLLHLG